MKHLELCIHNFLKYHKLLNRLLMKTWAEPQANGLLSTMHTYEFIFTLVLMLEVFQISNALSKQLQSPKLLMPESYTIINGVLLKFQNMRKDDSFFEKFWNEFLTVAKACDISAEPKLPRTRKTPAKLDGENTM